MSGGLLAALLLFGSSGTDMGQLATESVAAADAAIAAEVKADGFRVGLVVAEPRDTWLRTPAGGLKPVAREGSTHFVGVVLRDASTKRFLPRAKIRVSMGPEGEVGLPELVGEKFPVYGANVTLSSDQTMVFTVRADPPEYGRVANLRVLPTTGTRAAFDVAVDARGRATVSGEEVTPLEPGYEPGDDLRIALDDAVDSQFAGEYLVALIARAQRPYWRFEHGQTEERPVSPEENRHLEVALFSTQTGLPVTGAGVKLSLETSEGETVRELDLHPLAGRYLHYGENAEVPEGHYTVVATIQPPRTGSVGEPRFDDGAEVVFVWDSDQIATDADAPETSAEDDFAIPKLYLIGGLVILVLLVIMVTRANRFT